MSAIWVEIIQVRGSTPRGTGTAMKVTANDTQGTIGGGRLEFEAISHARGLLARGVKNDAKRKFSLGPNLGQCCGGAVELRFTRIEKPTDKPTRARLSFRAPASPKPLWIWGAGHVGRAIVNAAEDSGVPIVWADTLPSRFPSKIPSNVTVVPCEDLPRLSSKAPGNADHIILTYSHDIDFALCGSLLDHGANSIGLIGSETKRIRFFKRLRALGLDPSPIICPIGDKRLGKRPDQIAAGVLAQLLAEAAA